MGGFVAPGDALRDDNGINHRLFRQQPQGVRQRNAIPSMVLTIASRSTTEA